MTQIQSQADTPSLRIRQFLLMRLPLTWNLTLYVLVGEFNISWIIITVSLKQILRTTFFFTYGSLVQEKNYLRLLSLT